MSSALTNHPSLSLKPPKPDNINSPRSPCFVHSHLDSTISHASRLLNWLEPSNRHLRPPSSNALLSSSVLSPTTPRPHSISVLSDLDQEDDQNEDEPESISHQLAATAISFREISKQLRQTRIKSAIQSVLIITKARDHQLIRLTRELTVWLLSQTDLEPNSNDRLEHQKSSTIASKPIVVYVDHQLRESSRFDRRGLEQDHPQWFQPLASRHPYRRRFSRTSSTTSFTSNQSDGSFTSSGVDISSEDGLLRYWTPEMCAKSPELFDLVITLGGDGTVLFASWLFQRVVPPIVPFALGSLGFLTNFDYAYHQRVLRDAMQLGVRVNLRMRFNCTVYRASTSSVQRRLRAGKTGEIFMKLLCKHGWKALESGAETCITRRVTKKPGEQAEKEVICFSTQPTQSFEVLNELVVDRGPSPYVSMLEIFGNDDHLTTVQADGLTVSTPTGSTAYSLSAGGSLVHPEIPAMLITPICPHTLSFRPMLLPDTMELRIYVPYASRSTAWAAFDGRGRVELRQGDHIKITASAYPFPTVCADNQSTDWFQAISRTLRWNERERQKSFTSTDRFTHNGACQDDKASVKFSDKVNGGDVNDDDLDENDEEEEEEEQVFDIDDRSSDHHITKPNHVHMDHFSVTAVKEIPFLERPEPTPRFRISGGSSESLESGQTRTLLNYNGLSKPISFTDGEPNSSSSGSASDC
ncbi:hypothetical protein O181_022317 [Austropuccinia psidii MF-1]|uniref:NAD(+) kinase n=1 Tax=Austropuccinia psidii MF-1 TaxID=1389203 RepID=A0A9Q3CF84_9BASI|nr:hypothetical protein [Austropuccinia psidii MF-1]